jgi:hypothetical protein
MNFYRVACRIFSKDKIVVHVICLVRALNHHAATAYVEVYLVRYLPHMFLTVKWDYDWELLGVSFIKSKAKHQQPPLFNFH